MPIFKPRGIAQVLLAISILTLIALLAGFASYHGAPRRLLAHATQSLRGDLLNDINNATLGFQKIFVINLPTRTNNKDAMTLAGSLTGLEFDFVDGVTDVAKKALPPGGADSKLSPGELGNWRAHMNVAQRIVEQNIVSALVLEDDTDWDIRIKQQMQDFAKASRMLLQPLKGTTDQYLDPTYPRPHPDDQPTTFRINEERTAKPVVSPYGDTWDLLWIGHCGTYFPSANRSSNRPIGRVALLNDETVPEKQHLFILFGDDELRKEYPEHTRVVTRANRNICTFGYALSLRGAKHLLHEFSLQRLDEATDISFRTFCDGDRRPLGVCLTVQPELIQQHRPAGPKADFSDIMGYGDGVNEKAFSRNVRWSTRLNLEKLIEGETDYVDLYRDGEEAFDWGWG